MKKLIKDTFAPIMKDAMRYRELRRMIGPLQVIIGPQLDVDAHRPGNCTPEQIREMLDAALDARIALNHPAPDRGAQPQKVSP